MNAINEIAQHTSEIFHRPGKDLIVPDLLSRPFPWGKAHLSPVVEKDPLDAPDYVSPAQTLAALEEVALQNVSPEMIHKAQQSCPDVANHKKGNLPKGVKMSEEIINGVPLYCEVSQANNPRPLLPKDQRSLVLNLLHHLDHPGQRESLRRASASYYWPDIRKDVEGFVKSCHPCQVAKQSGTVNPGVGAFPVPDQRFSVIHIDVVGPLPVSEGQKYLLSVFCRTSRWFECYPMPEASSKECCKALMGWIQRFGCPTAAVSDNGNTFVANLYQDIMKNFNIDVKFTPAYHAAANGAVERRHQTIKNALKAALVDMGNTHRDQWMRALPWVLLGKRVAFQPDLGTSASMLTFGKSVSIPGQLLGHPGPPLNNEETKSLLEELYKMSAQPALPTSTNVDPIDITYTENATHVYVKVANPKSLCPRFEGPYKIEARPSRSQVTVRVGSFASGAPRLLTFHWSLCKIANLRSSEVEASRQSLGRKKKSDTPSSPEVGDILTTKTKSTDAQGAVNKPVAPLPPPFADSNERPPFNSVTVNDGAKIQTTNRPVRATRNQNPNYVSFIAMPA